MTDNLRAVLAAATILGAWSAVPASAAPTYGLLTTIPVAVGTAKFTGYDLSTIDPTTQLYYLTDRSAGAVDVISTQTNMLVTRLGQGSNLFAGVGSGPSPNDNAGPNGISITTLQDGTKLLLAGNTGANSTGNVIAFNLAANGTTINMTRSISTAAATTPTPTNRVDGVAFAPTTNTILTANNASNPGYVTLINNATNAIIKTQLLNGVGIGVPNVAGNGVEGVIFNTATKTFFVNVPNLTSAADGTGTGFGGVIEIDPANGNILRTFDFKTLGLGGPCNPTGLVQGANGTMGAACGTPGYTVVLDPFANNGLGKLTSSTAVSGGDQTAYDPALNLFYEAARFDPNGPALGIFNGDGSFAQRLPITTNDHAVSVDPNNGEVLVAFGASTGQYGSANYADCASGCVAVYAPVPEPGTMAVLGSALLGLGTAFRRRRS